MFVFFQAALIPFFAIEFQSQNVERVDRSSFGKEFDCSVFDTNSSVRAVQLAFVLVKVEVVESGGTLELAGH